MDFVDESVDEVARVRLQTAVPSVVGAVDLKTLAPEALAWRLPLT